MNRPLPPNNQQPAPAAAATSARQDARSLHKRLNSAFQSNVTTPEKRLHSFKRLREDLAAGVHGGVPLTGDAPAALVSLLDELGWIVDIERFARSAPHFPQRFTQLELREFMARLGFDSHARKLRLSQIAPRLLPAIVVSGTQITMLKASGDGKSIIAVDPATGAERRLDKHRRLLVISFAQSSEGTSGEATGRSWIGGTLRRFRREILELFGLTSIINVMVLMVSFAVMSIYDKVIPARAYDTLLAICVGIALAASLELAFRYLKSQLIGHITGRLEYLLGTAIFSKLISLPMHMVSNTPVGDQIARLRQFESVRDLFAGPFVAVGLELPFVVLFTIGLFAIAGPLGYVPMALIATYAIIGALMIGPVRHQTQLATRRRREHYHSALETVSNLRLLRSIGCEDVWLDRLEKKAADSAAAKRRANLSQRLLTTVSSAAVPIAGGSTVVLGAVLVIEQSITVGMLIGAMIIVWRVLAPIQQLFLMLSRYTEMSQTITQIDQMMRLPSLDTVKRVPIRRSFSGSIAFDRVSFRHPAATHPTVQGLNFNITPGMLVAIQGHSGAGKSTVLQLILDLHRPQVGSVQIDGVNVRQIPATDLRPAIGYVPQNPVLFHGTIAQNLRLSSPGASEQRLRTICHEIGLLESIEQLPKGLDTLLDHARQENLPGGFRQALSIAQALLRDPQILLLDEPAKTLDHALENALVASIAKRRGDTTIVMVSHRPSHIRLCDRVLLLNQGQLVSFDPPQPLGQVG